VMWPTPRCITCCPRSPAPTVLTQRQRVR
jgi:hypothetical protein